MEPAIIGQVTFLVETLGRAFVAAVAGPVVVRHVHGGHLGEGELPVVELVQLAVEVPRVLVAVRLEGPHLLVVRFLIRAPVLVIKNVDVAGEWGELQLLNLHREPWRTVNNTKIRSGKLGCGKSGWRGRRRRLVVPPRSEGRRGRVNMTHLRSVDGLDTGHRGGNTRDGVLALAVDVVLLGAGLGLLPSRTGGCLGVHGRAAGQMGHQLGAGDSLHVQGLG